MQFDKMIVTVRNLSDYPNYYNLVIEWFLDISKNIFPPLNTCMEGVQDFKVKTSSDWYKPSSVDHYQTPPTCLDIPRESKRRKKNKKKICKGKGTIFANPPSEEPAC